MQIPYYHVDAFTDKVFEGNPAGVCPLTSELPDSTLQKIATENNLSETAFFLARGKGSYSLRWFTPSCEVDLCGHATLATAHVLWKHEGASGSKLQFESKSGLLTVNRGDHGLMTLDFPSRPAVSCPPPEDVNLAFSITPRSCGKARDYLFEFESEEVVRNLKPDMLCLARWTEVMGVIVTAPGRDVDFVSRFFAPSAGVPEDPVTGSSHCTLIPFWAERLQKNVLHARQVSRRGGELFCEGNGDRVKIGGRAVTYLKGILEV